MWREKLVDGIRDFLTHPQTRRQHHMAMFELLETGDVSTGVLTQWDGTSPLCLCENCHTLNQTGYLHCRRCTGRLRYQPRLQAKQVRSHLDVAEDVSPNQRLRSRTNRIDSRADFE